MLAGVNATATIRWNFVLPQPLLEVIINFMDLTTDAHVCEGWTRGVPRVLYTAVTPTVGDILLSACGSPADPT